MKTKQKYKIPQSYKERANLRSRIQDFVDNQLLRAPLSMDDLSNLSDRIINENFIDPDIKGWIMVEVNNSVWRETVAAIPYEKRILLLPKCLSNSTSCEAEFDEFGLLCHRCQSCSIPGLEDKAAELGMMSIVAEGFTSVVELIKNRVVDTVIGVSCLESLEKAFPLLVNNALPGLAIALNNNGCKDSDVDRNYVERMISMKSEKEVYQLDYDHLKSTLKGWFSNEGLSGILEDSDDQTSSIAKDWLGGEGKRWRPYLLVATYLALKKTKEIPEGIRLAAIAVECFHKASLVHDDIQDDDSLRYGKQTVNAAYGVPVAINVGDILLGEGYRLMADTGNIDLIKVASDAHIALCKGQGMELEWCLSPHELTMDFILNIFKHKTVPAFHVALQMGAICADGGKELEAILHKYSTALGIAYQLQDDMEDFDTDEDLALRPSAVLAMLCEINKDAGFINSLLRSGDPKVFLSIPENKPFLTEALDRVGQMAEQYHKNALNALDEITDIELKRLLFRIARRMLK